MSFEIPRPERHGEQIAQPHHRGGAPWTGENHINITTEVHQHLSASAAGRCKILCIGHDSDRLELPYPFRAGLENGSPLGTQGKGVCADFNIASGKYPAVRPEEGGTDTETGVGGMRMPPGCSGPAYESGIFPLTHENQMNISIWRGKSKERAGEGGVMVIWIDGFMD